MVLVQAFSSKWDDSAYTKTSVFGAINKQDIEAIQDIKQKVKEHAYSQLQPMLTKYIVGFITTDTYVQSLLQIHMKHSSTKGAGSVPLGLHSLHRSEMGSVKEEPLSSGV